MVSTSVPGIETAGSTDRLSHRDRTGQNGAVKRGRHPRLPQLVIGQVEFLLRLLGAVLGQLVRRPGILEVLCGSSFSLNSICARSKSRRA